MNISPPPSILNIPIPQVPNSLPLPRDTVPTSAAVVCVNAPDVCDVPSSPLHWLR